MKEFIRTMILLLGLSIIFTACSGSSENKKEQFEEKVQETAKISDAVKVAAKPESELYPAYIMTDGRQKWGYIDETGSFAIKAEYDSASDFQKNGLAVVMKDQKAGIIDKTGKFIVEPRYSSITDYKGKTAIASENWSKYYLIGEKGQVLFETEGTIDNFKCGLAAFSKRINSEKSVWGYIDEEGKVVVEPKYEYGREFVKDRALAQISESKHAVIDTTGKVVKEIEHDKIMGFSEDMFVFAKSGDNGYKYGYMSLDGKVVIDTIFSYAYEFEDGLAMVNAAEDFNNHYGVINKNGEYIIPAKYPVITYLGSGLYAVPEIQEYTFNTMYLRKALFDKAGKQLTDFKFYDMEKLDNGLISVTDEKDTYIIDENGKEVSNTPKIKGVGTIKPSGKLYKIEADSDLYYMTDAGRTIWKSDNTIRYDGGLEIKRLAFRPDRCMLIEYPEINGIKDSIIQQTINKKLKAEFVGEYKSSSKEGEVFTEVVDIGYGAEKNKDLLVIGKNGYYYPIGAAHGQPYREEYHININNGKFYSLNDLFRKDSKYKEKLSSILKKKIKKLNDEEGASMYSEDIGDLDESSGFTVKGDSLQIYFYPYAIAPYAAGFPEFDIAYEEIKDIIDTEGEFWKAFERKAASQTEDSGVISASEKAKMERAIEGYEKTIIEAINKNDFKIVESWLYPESSLYTVQMKLVEDLNHKNIKERLESYSISEIRPNTTGNIYRAYVTENIAIQYPGKDYVTKQFNWVYSMKYDFQEERYLLTYIEKWDKK